MGNSFGCSASGEGLVSAARDGDVVEAKMLLDCNPCLAKYSTFGGLNSPFHFAAAKGHNEIVALLLGNGADVNSRNYCGQVTRADYLSGRTALHFAAVNGHVRCMRLVLADFVPSVPFDSLNSQTVSDGSDGSNNKTNYLSKFVNKAADGGITALHMAALNGYFDCVQLLLDLHAHVSAVTFHYGTSMDLIGAGSTPLHCAACGGNLKRCQLESHVSAFFSSQTPPPPTPCHHPALLSTATMVKFSKELEAQLIPEWKHAFLNYWLLKKHVKKIKLARNPKHAPNPTCDFGRSLFDPVLVLFGKFFGSASCPGDTPENIQVQSKNSVVEDEMDENEHAHLFSEEYEVKVFFEILDDELEKVDQFYMDKEREFLQRGELLNKQLQILLNLKRVLSDRRRNILPTNMGGDSVFPSVPSSPLHRNSDFSEESRSEHCASPNDLEADDVVAALEKNGVKFEYPSKPKKGVMKPKISMRIDIPATTPARTIAAVTSMLREDFVISTKKGGECINRSKIQCAEKMIRGAFVELYRGLGLLKTFSSLNMTAFTKILKKFDKVSNQQASVDYLKTVKTSNFIKSDKVVRLRDEVESLFTEHYTNNDRKRAMKFLRPLHHKDSHVVTFFVGLFTGSFVTLFSVYAILAHITGMFSPATKVPYMESVYPIFSMFALLSLHLFMYGCNLFMWKITRINYNFIFEFQSRTALKYRDAFLICTCLMTAVVAAMVLHVILLATGFFPHQVNYIPGILLLCFVLLLICPFNLFYRSTRYCFLRVMRNIICSPFYKVLMVDFFMADQLTSQIPLLRHVESASCYFLAGSFKTHNYEICKSGRLYRELAYVISFAPYYWRAMQCARRWFDECNPDHLANLGKYVSAMVAAGARLTYTREPSQLWMAIVLVTSVVATVYQLYWDFVKDWGLLNPKSKNPWLRDDLVLKNKGTYYVSIALNFVLRVAWVETVMRFNIGMLESRLLDFFLASLEVIRRGHWNYYRLENEHLNNAGKFRAVKTAPLPFRDGL